MKFEKDELRFIREVLNIQAEEEEERGEVLEEIWEEACEIEIYESNRLEELTDQGRMAVHLVTKIGGTGNPDEEYDYVPDDG